MNMKLKMSSFMSSNIEGSAPSQSQSGRRRRAADAKSKHEKREKVVVAVANEAREDSQFPYQDNNIAHLLNIQINAGTAAVAPAAASPVLHALQSSVLQYYSAHMHMNANVNSDEQLNIQNREDVPFWSLSAQRFSCSDETTTTTNTTSTSRVTSTKQEQEAEAEAEAEEVSMHRSVGTSTSISSNVGEDVFQMFQPFSDYELMHLGNMFDEHERERPSREEDLCSVLSLNREATVENVMMNL